MQEDYFDDYLKLMRAYIKTLRLSFNGHTDWARLDTFPSDYHVQAMQVRRLISKEYQTLPDSKWREKIKYYKQAQDNFDAEHQQEGSEYCQHFIKKHRESLDEYYGENKRPILIAEMETGQQQEAWNHYMEIKATKEFHQKQYKQNQSYMDALIRTRKEIDRWVEITLSSEEKKQLETEDIPNQTQQTILKENHLSLVLEARQPLYETLCRYVDETDRQALHDLIFDKSAPSSKIVVVCLVKEFGLTFVQSGAVPASGGTLLSKQLCEFFLRRSVGKLHSFHPDNLVKYLRLKQ